MARYVPEEIEAYAERYTSARADLFDRLGAETRATQTAPQMMVGPIEGAFLAFLAVPFIGASSASAYPDFTVSVTCTATNGQSGSKVTWEWWQGGIGGSGTLLAIGSVRCPDIAGSGTSSATASGIQPASADTLAFLLDSVASNGCGGTGSKDISFTPGSSVSTKLSVTGKSPCSYAVGPKDTVRVDASLQS